MLIIIITSILQIRSWRHREIRQLAQGHTTSKTHLQSETLLLHQCPPALGAFAPEASSTALDAAGRWGHVSDLGGRAARTLKRGDRPRSQERPAWVPEPWDLGRRIALTSEAWTQVERKNISPDLEPGLPEDRGTEWASHHMPPPHPAGLANSRHSGWPGRLLPSFHPLGGPPGRLWYTLQPHQHSLMPQTSGLGKSGTW